MTTKATTKGDLRHPDPHWVTGYPLGVKDKDKELVPAIPAGPEQRQALARPEQSPSPPS